MNFAALHLAEKPLLLPNAWDVGSAIAFADAGFKAVGTTSFGVGAAAGHSDGARRSKDATLTLVRALKNFPMFVSADIEDGYSDNPEEVADFVAILAPAGVNIEDDTGGHLIEPELHAAKVTCIKKKTPAIFVNARIDNYWLHEDASIESVLARAKLYVDAGADGIFVPGVTDPEDIKRLASNIPVPLNVLATPGMALEELAALGVRRVSTGSLPYRVAIDAGLAVATSLRGGGKPLSATSYAAAQILLEKYEDKLQQ